VKRFLIETWGCQMNVHDSEKMAGILRRAGYEPAGRAEDADLVLLNTCSVREKAASKIFDRLGRLRLLKKRRPGMMLGVAGCVAQMEGETIFRRAPWVDLVMGPRTLGRLDEFLEEAHREGRSLALAREDEPIVFPSGTAARARGPKAYVTVMEGCNKSCAFCIVPVTRGREVYRKADEIVAETAALLQDGFVEIELLGQNVNSWHDEGCGFGGLLRMIDRLPGLRRLRFTTSHPGHLDRAIMEAMRDCPSVCNHLHLPAQSGSDRVLKAMRRGYTRARYLSKIAFLRSAVPGIAFSSDLIVGFPGESEEDFQATLELVREARFAQIYAFTFSPRPGTRAAHAAETVPSEVQSERLQRLLALQDEIAAPESARLVGGRFEVLVDGPSRLDPSVASGRTRCNRIVHLSDPRPAGAFVEARIMRAHAHSLTGEPVSPPSAA
jgi:tRNA-2-methylthio-N6-dimethylallyladenosine synthase